jgi:DNA replication protein DnaC
VLKICIPASTICPSCTEKKKQQQKLEEMRQKKTNLEQKLSSIPEVYRNLDPAIVPIPPNILNVYIHYQFAKPIFFIGGRSSSGKSLLAYQIIKRKIEENIDLNFHVMDFNVFSRRSFSNYTLDPEFEDYKKAQLLFIDNFGIGNINSKILSEIFEIIEYRIMRNKNTIIACPLSKSELKKAFNCHSLIYEMLSNRLKQFSDWLILTPANVGASHPRT